MATSEDYLDYVLDCLRGLGEVEAKRMMGEYCLYFKGKLVGLICDNRFLVKRTSTSDRLFPDGSLDYPYPGSKTLMHVVDFEDREKMKVLLEGLYRELPDKKRP